MSDNLTTRMLDLYEQKAAPTMFLSSLFQTPPKNFYNSESVEIDVKRFSESVSIVIQDLSDGGRYNASDLYTNKRFIPPIHKEKGPLNAFDLIKREAGNTPFDDINFQAVASDRALTLIAEMSNKIRRAIELQASQVLQTATLSLKDENGNILYALDYKPKITHFPTAVVAWDQSSNTIMADIEALATVLRTDGQQTPDQLIMGSAAWEAFISDDAVQQRYDIRRYDLGTIAPVPMNSDAGTYMGTVRAGNYMFDVWTYNGFYEDPETLVVTPFLDPAKVIMRASVGRLDATYGNIPTFGNPAAGILPYMPPRLSSASLGSDIFTNAYLTETREQIIVSASSRPLLIPTAIDTFGCIATGVGA